MTSSESHRRGSSHHSRVITVAAKTTASSKLKQTGDRKSSRNRTRTKNTSIAQKMWDNFDSESSSGDDTEHDEREAKKPLQSDGESPASGLLVRKDIPDCAPKSNSSEKNNPPAVDAKKSSGSASNEDVASCRDSQFESNFHKGDNISVGLTSDEQAKGTIPRVSSRGTYDLTLANGKTLKDADPDVLTFASRRRESSFRNPGNRARSRSGDHSDKESGEDSVSERKASSKTAAQPSSLTKERIEKPAEHDLASARPSEVPENSGAAEEQQNSESSGLSSVGSMMAEAPKMLAIDSEMDGRNRGTRSTSEQGSLPVANTVQHAEGLLKTIFQRKAGEAIGESSRDTVGEKPNRNTPRVKSANRRFFADSHQGDVRNEEDPVDLKDSEDSVNQVIAGENEYKTTSEGTLDAARGNNPILGNGLPRGLSASPRKHAEKSKPSASHSRSLAVKIGNTLRGAIMGKTQLGVFDARGKRTQVDGPEGNSSSEGAYSTEGSEAGDLQRENSQRTTQPTSRGSRSKGKISRENAGEDGGSGNGFDNGICASPTTRVDSPKNLPEVVSSYIEARARMERDLSASGPIFLPRSGNLAAGPREGAATPWVRRRASVDITKEASSTTQLSGQRQPFTEAMLKVGVSETKHSTKQGILLEGDLQKFSPESLRGVRWHKRYFVLYGGSGELRYYRSHAEAAWGRVPLGERGSIPLRLVVKIEQPSDKKYQGNRFNLVVLHKGNGRHPGLHIRPGHETRVTTTKTFKLSASDAQQRLLWVTVIEALMKRHGWGMDVERSHESCVIGVGATSGSNRDRLMETGRGRENSAAPVELHRAGPGDAATALGYDSRLSHLKFGNASSKSMVQRVELGPNFSSPSLLTTMGDSVNVQDSWRRHTSGTVGWSTATFSPSQRDIPIPHCPHGKEILTTDQVSSTEPISGSVCHSDSLRPTQGWI